MNTKTFTSPNKIVQSQLLVRKLQSYSLMMRSLSLENMRTMEKIKFSLKVYDKMNKSAQKSVKKERSLSTKKKKQKTELKPIPFQYIKTLKQLQLNDAQFQQLLIQQLQLNLAIETQSNKQRTILKKQQNRKQNLQKLQQNISILKTKLDQKQKQLNLYYEYQGFRRNPQTPNSLEQQLNNFQKLKQRQLVQLQQQLQQQTNTDNIKYLTQQIEETKEEITDAQQDINFLVDMKNTRMKLNREIEQRKIKNNIEKARIAIALESIQDQNLSLMEQQLELQQLMSTTKPYFDIPTIHNEACRQIQQAIVTYNTVQLIRVAHQMPVLKKKMEEKVKQNKKMREKVEMLDKKLTFLRAKAQRILKVTDNPEASTTSL